MTVMYSLTPELRRRLKQPLGVLVQGSFTETMNTIEAMVEKERPRCIIAVGDTVSKNLEKSQMIPQLSIVDNRVMRKRINQSTPTAERTVRVRNPPATITSEAIRAIENSLEVDTRTRIVVEGEEDLLTLVAVLYAPENSFVVYGQPYQGVVIIRVTPTKKTEVEVILKAMETARKAK